jgi:hypothetical protein
MVSIAQLVEQSTENPRVTSSNLVPGTEKRIYLIYLDKSALILTLEPSFLRELLGIIAFMMTYGHNQTKLRATYCALGFPLGSGCREKALVYELTVPTLLILMEQDPVPFL